MIDPLAKAVLDEISRSAGLRADLLKPFEAGENRSTFVVDAGAERLVLKLDPPERLAAHERAARACRHLDRLGYPVPWTIAVGTAAGRAYTLRTCLPGAPMSPDDGRHAGRLIALVELQAGAARGAGLSADDWPGSVVDPVLHGGQGFCVLDTMREHSAETAALLERLQDLVSAGADTLPTPDDILHYDFNPANILIDGGAVSGVVDWEGVRPGDRAFDLATLLFYAYDAERTRAALRTRLRELRPPRVIAVYFAHIILRQVEWSLRLHPAEVGRRYLDRAQAVLRDLVA